MTYEYTIYYSGCNIYGYILYISLGSGYNKNMEYNSKDHFSGKMLKKTKDALVVGATALTTLGGSTPVFGAESDSSMTYDNPKASTEYVGVPQDINQTLQPDTYEGSWEHVSQTKSTESGNESLSSIRLDLNIYFETGSAEIQTADRERIQTDFSTYLAQLPKEILENLESGEMTIVIEASCSPAAITKPIEVIPGSGLYAKNNEELARYRAEAVMPILENIISERNLSNIHFDVLIPKGGVSESKEKKVSIRAEYNHELYKQIFEQSFNEHTIMVILDESRSMLDKRDAALEVIHTLNERSQDSIKTVTLQGGSTEMHLKTMEDIISDVSPQENPSYIYIITDEMDETVENIDPRSELGQKAIEEYKTRIRKVIAEGQAKNIHFVVNYMGNGITKTTHFSDNPDVLLDQTVYEFVDADGSVHF